jgi:hypothetical protein
MVQRRPAAPYKATLMAQWLSAAAAGFFLSAHA